MGPARCGGCVMKRGMHTAVSRRRLLQGAAAGLFGAAGAAVLAACGETQVVTKEVIKEVPVERVVTKEVIKEVPVETVVTKEVIKEVVVERVVTKESDQGSHGHGGARNGTGDDGPVSGGTITVGAGTPSTPLLESLCAVGQRASLHQRLRLAATVVRRPVGRWAVAGTARRLGPGRGAKLG